MKLTRHEKDLIAKLEGFYKDVKERKVINEGETHAEQEVRKANLLKDYKKFFGYYFAHYMPEGKNTIADFHTEAANHILKNPSRLCFQLPRGHGKTVTMCLGVPIWLLLKKEFKLALFLGRNKDSAQKLLSSLRIELSTNPMLKHDYGEFFKRKVVSPEEFVVENKHTGDVMFKSVGRMAGAVRGLRFKDSRVDYIVADDVSDNELANSKPRATKLYNWFIEAVCQTVRAGYGRIVVCENKYHENCLSSFVEQNKNFKTIRVDAYKKNGEPVWPQYHTIESLEAVRAEMGHASFEREYMNHPITEGAVFKPEWLGVAEPLDKYKHIVSYTDPSWTAGKQSDYKAIVTVGVTKEKQFHILDIFCRKVGTKEMLDYIFKLWRDKFKSRAKYYIEASFMQDSMVKQELEKHSDLKLMPLLYDKRKKENKFARIEKMEPYFARGEVFLSKKLEGLEDTEIFKQQLFSFDPKQGSKNHDDAIDAFQGALKKIIDKYKYKYRAIGGFRKSRIL